MRSFYHLIQFVSKRWNMWNHPLIILALPGGEAITPTTTTSTTQMSVCNFGQQCSSFLLHGLRYLFKIHSFESADKTPSSFAENLPPPSWKKFHYEGSKPLNLMRAFTGGSRKGYREAIVSLRHNLRTHIMDKWSPSIGCLRPRPSSRRRNVGQSYDFNSDFSLLHSLRWPPDASFVTGIL